MSFETLILERPAPGVALIRLNRVDKHNAINARMSAELIECLDALEADDEVRAVVLTGAGEKSFCAGADMGESVQRMASGERRDAAAAAAVRLARVRKPVIAAVNGYAFGGGAVFAICCDMRICSESARLSLRGSDVRAGCRRQPAAAHRRRAGGEGPHLHRADRRRGGGASDRPGQQGRSSGRPRSGATEIAAAIAENDPAAVIASKEVIDLATFRPEAARREIEHNVQLRQSDEHRARFRAAARRLTGDKP